MNGDNRDIKEQADFLEGFGAAMEVAGRPHPMFTKAVQSLRKMARSTCGAGYVGCHGGPDCSGDHK